MQYRTVESTQEYVARLEHGCDSRAEEFATAEDIDSAFFVGLGAVRDATVYYYDQDECTYQSVQFDEPLEVTPVVGNISKLEGEPSAHTHTALSRRDGTTLAGHLDKATTFAGELYLTAFKKELAPEYNPKTELDLWSLDGEGG